ncbi:alpha/beta hydrolase [Pseudonocardia pini]|uniref:alpha/beta hydrolase n=1 Tax=Pseudonocardia pini TaxID=2758030 RepID=UPI0015F05A16|nr:alpha/beta hydrolase [Pseudonocardia pini]
MRPTWRSVLSRTTALVAAAVVVAGCAAGAEPAEAVPAPPVPPPVAWAECGPNLDCATVEVPLDYAEPEGRQVPIAVVRHRAGDPAQRIGSLFYNPGGPGAPATDVVRGIGTMPGAGYFSPDVVARFDIVGMDPRGIGDSGEVRCLSDDQRRAQLSRDGDPAVVGGRPEAELVADADELAAGCAANQDPAYLASLSTDTVARDMDQVRAALGERQLTYLGASYGTLLGATYATLFPQSVRQMVLDAPADPDLWRNDPLEATTQQAVAGERALDLWFETCRTEGAATCPFGAGDPEAAFDALVDRLEAQPIAVPASPTGVPAGTLDGYWALVAARTAVFDRTLWPVLTAGLLTAEQGDGTLLWTLAMALTMDPETGAPNGLTETNLAVNCMDRAVPTDLAAHTAQAATASAQTPRFATASGYNWLSCASWPVQNTDRYTERLTGAGAPPILVVGGRVDSQTPYPWAQAMVDDLESSVLLTREGIGHGSYRTSGPCIDTAVDATLIDGVLPADGTVCAQEPPATTAPAVLGGG